MRTLAQCLTTTLVVFLATAFAQWNLNPAHWGVDSRTGAAMTSGIVCLMVVIGRFIAVNTTES